MKTFFTPRVQWILWKVHLNYSIDTYRDNSCTTSDRFVNWTAASETHQRESNIFIIQQNNRSVKDRSFSRKIESERSFFIPLKRILLRRFEGLIRCVRERRYYGSHIKESEKNLARQVSFCWKLKRSRIAPTPPSMCPQTHTLIVIYNILYTSEICKHYMAIFKMPKKK